MILQRSDLQHPVAWEVEGAVSAQRVVVARKRALWPQVYAPPAEAGMHGGGTSAEQVAPSPTLRAGTTCCSGQFIMFCSPGHTAVALQPGARKVDARKVQADKRLQRGGRQQNVLNTAQLLSTGRNCTMDYKHQIQECAASNPDL